MDFNCGGEEPEVECHREADDPFKTTSEATCAAALPNSAERVHSDNMASSSGVVQPSEVRLSCFENTLKAHSSALFEQSTLKQQAVVQEEILRILMEMRINQSPRKGHSGVDRDQVEK